MVSKALSCRMILSKKSATFWAHALAGAASLVALELCLLLFAPVCAAAQSAPPSAPDLGQKGAELSGHRLELRGMEDTLDASQEQRRQIEAEIASIRADRAKLTAALLDATHNVNVSERKIGETEARLDTLTGAEDAIKRSLASGSVKRSTCKVACWQPTKS